MLTLRNPARPLMGEVTWVQPRLRWALSRTAFADRTLAWARVTSACACLRLACMRRRLARATSTLARADSTAALLARLLCTALSYSCRLTEPSFTAGVYLSTLSCV